MSYNHQEIDWWISPAAGNLTTSTIDPLTAGVVNYRPGYQPMMAIAVYGLVIVAPTTTPPVVAFKFRPTIGSATGEIVIGTLTFPLATSIVGNMIFKTVDNVKLLPAGEVVVSVTTASAAGNIQFGLMVAPNWDSPGNNLKMVRSA